ncbi:MoxR-like ATPase [Bernardetia litoralis DSM 6794]|uniref:MoxR-like ATPase n=1 Tax=Bernardetia litoralis (strain ATCC 23117 / DSM 6794 / NBRC 15988 / NCIMB 1366 / Fx l1 / Sio-4) TaxID=880071 RepID=I4ANR3_BERLS|nr:AAA family ATPase [Bernardetia litoralis]AFM05598.1 MoxR-like ATPase [Bernardetia litoralis DSM 6794]
MQTTQTNALEKLNSVLSFIKNSFVGKDEVIDLLGIALIARENAFLLGAPGTAKSAIIRMLSSSVKDGQNFEYLLTRFTEPNELFGAFDIRKLKEGELITNTTGMLPEASVVFLDEIFNANSAILNSLLMALNERIFRRGQETKKLPALMFVGASNQLPEDEALGALLDRFLVRVKCENVNPNSLEAVLMAGRKLEKGSSNNEQPIILPKEITELQNISKQVDLSEVLKTYLDLIHSLRNTGVKVSDRRAVKIQNLVAASAVMCGREKAILSDLWVLKYIWDNEEQVEILQGIIDAVIEKDLDRQNETGQSFENHPQALSDKTPNAEELIKEILNLQKEWENENQTYEKKNLIKDKLRYLQNRSNWIKNTQHKTHIQEEIEKLWQKILVAHSLE